MRRDALPSHSVMEIPQSQLFSSAMCLDVICLKPYVFNLLKAFNRCFFYSIYKPCSRHKNDQNCYSSCIWLKKCIYQHFHLHLHLKLLVRAKGSEEMFVPWSLCSHTFTYNVHSQALGIIMVKQRAHQDHGYCFTKALTQN